MDLYKASQRGDLERIKEIVEENRGELNITDILSKPDADGIPALHWAALNGRWLVCKYLLSNGVLVDNLGGDQNAPAIHWAICKGHSSVVSLFIRNGADWRLFDSQGYNSMHVAAQNGQEMIILLLKAHGADINSPDRAGRTPLLWAAYRGHGPVVELLIQNGANLDLTDETGRTPLHWAIIKGQAVCSAKLAKAGAAFDIRDVEGKLPADWAREKEISWFDKLQKITFDYRRSKTKPRGKSLEFIGTVIIPSLLTPTLLLTFAKISTWWWSTLIGSVLAFVLYNISAQICIPPGVNLPETSFLAYYNYSTLAIVVALCFGYLVPTQLTRNPILAILCASFALLNSYSLYKLKFSDAGKLALPRSDSEKDQTVCQLGNDGILDKRHFCTTCSIRKPLRSKHCKTCDRCVGKFDHHCPWVNNCVGLHNHRTFVTYLYSSIGLAFTFIPLTWKYFHNTIDQTIARSSSCFILSDHICRASNSAPVLFWISTFGAFMTFWLLLLTVTQTYQIIKNLTTNELSNYSRLEYFYPELKEGDVPFEQIKDEEKSKRYVNVFDEGIIGNWIEFWKHPMTKRHNFNTMEEFTEEDLRRARMRLNRLSKGHHRSVSETSIPLINNFLNNLSPKRECCSGHHHQNNEKQEPILQSNTSKHSLIEIVNSV